MSIVVPSMPGGYFLVAPPLGMFFNRRVRVALEYATPKTAWLKITITLGESAEFEVRETIQHPWDAEHIAQRIIYYLKKISPEILSLAP